MTTETYFKLMNAVSITRNSTLKGIYRFAVNQADAEQVRARHYAATRESLEIQPIKSNEFVIIANTDELGIAAPLASTKTKREAEKVAKSIKVLFPRWRLAIVPATDISLSAYFIKGGN